MYSSILNSLLWWKVDDQYLKYQVKNYNKLSIVKSAKGLLALLTIILAITSLIAVLDTRLNHFDLISDIQFLHWQLLYYINIGAAIIYLALVYFVYKGNKLATIAWLIFFTVNQILSFVFSDLSYRPLENLVADTLIWYVLTKFAYLSYKVEVAREKL